MEGGKDQLRAEGGEAGSALVWVLESGATESDRNIVEQRPGGVSLIVILPRVADLANDPTILHLIEACCPHGILPFHERLAERELAQVLKRPPDDLSASVTDYLAWRGIRIDRDTVHLIRRTIDNSADLHSISALARSMYVSRRALGRRFLSRGRLPVPSYWLQLGRLLRVAIKRQNSRESIFSVAYKFGYLVADMNAIQLTAEARGLRNDPARAPSGVSSTHAGVRQVAGAHRAAGGLVARLHGLLRRGRAVRGAHGIPLVRASLPPPRSGAFLTAFRRRHAGHEPQAH